MRLKIKVTKDILRKAMWCGTEKAKGFITRNCAVALALQDIFPDACAGVDHLTLHNIRSGIYPWTDVGYLDIDSVRNFMMTFDQCKPDQRPLLPGFELEVELPENVIQAINIDDIHKSPTLEVVV